MVATLPRLPQRIAEIHLRAAVGGEILHQQRAAVVVQVALDLRVAPESFRLLANVLHRQREPVRDPSRIGNAGSLAARDYVERLVTDVAFDRCHGEIEQALAQARVGDDLAHVRVDRARPAGREDEGLVRVEQHRLHFQQHFRGLLREELLFDGGGRERLGHGRRPVGWLAVSVEHAPGARNRKVWPCGWRTSQAVQ